MTKSEAIAIVSNRKPDCSKREVTGAWQYLVQSGEAWSLPRWYGDMASALIERGEISR